MIEGNKKDALRRLQYAKGHLDGIERMLEQDKYCVDVLKQLFAVRKSLEKLEGVLIEGHLQSCLVEGMQQGKHDQLVKELVELYSVAKR